MSWRDAPLVKPAGAWQAAPMAEPQSGMFAITPAGMIDQATWDRIARDKPQLAQALLEEHSASQVAGDVGTGQAIRIGAGKSFADLGTGIKQLAQMATGSPDAERYTREIQSDLNAYKTLADQKPIATGAGELLGDVAATAPIPLGTAALSIRGLGAAAGVNAGVSGVEFTPEGGNRLENAGYGAAFGAGGHAAMGVAGKVLNEGRNLIADVGGYAARKMPRLQPSQETINSIRGGMRSTREQDLFTKAAQEGVPLTAPDASGKLQAIDGLLGRLALIGNSGVRQKQADWAKGRLERLRNDYVRYVGGDGSDEIKEAVFGQLNRSREQVGRMYDDVTQLAGDDAVLTPRLQQTASQILRQAKTDIKNPDMQNSAVVQMADKFSVDAGLNFSGARDLRSRMRQEIRSATENRLVGPREAGQLNRLASALEEDMGEFARSKGGGLHAKWRAADSMYRNNVVPFKDNLLARAKSEESFDLMLEEWVKNPRRLRKVVNVADEKGKDAIRLAIIDRAMSASHAGQAGNEYISPERFARNVRNMASGAPEIFSGPKGKELAGLTNIMRHMSAVDRTLTTPQNGMGAMKDIIAVASPGAAAAGIGSMVGSGGAGAALYGGLASVLRYAYGSKSGARLISSAADMRNDPKGLQYLWDSLRRIAERNASILDGSMPPGEDD